MLTASQDGTARLWSVARHTNLLAFQGHRGPVRSAVFSPDGERAHRLGRRYRESLEYSKPASSYSPCAGTMAPLTGRVSPNGLQILTAASDKTIGIWDAWTRVNIGFLRGHTDEVNDAMFSRMAEDSQRFGRQYRPFVGGGFPKVSRVLRGHQNHVLSARFSPDGREVVTSSWDDTARLWDVATGNAVAVLRGHRAVVTQAIFWPDGSKILTTSLDSTVRFWPNFPRTQQLGGSSRRNDGETGIR